ncbi:MAG: hypothetical protein UR39_C0005G0020 [Candidatus Woesebacteria bacterium GW2011_GWA1_33_30]|uniref:Uncharacterized protein n=1 Tax=Candidatus Woesebacteria bacterium GW2011_GWA2_33_28 TaxID=1618561 RepID=A0A0G0CVA3_9BACT|nr:MAG: hypothetical protein UR38_C0005G0020 [Candidatus Woesebacteria bacterium GW2011_GWA2_33_28]KKP48138.1 MAG: hypothetical protein UR39_C0005G0020 [Candidatus Woesebacteria bacterium GW2011_GWA1_33_30]KKP49380.1 MAG: hypothetical protein UR40_C0006G0020 [Microgenomates group bacterium GW2011_GWC1_33_32]KKP52106.1 MAG: hypothetical protein UR44_C0004G0020 [Candidatus Woesebacteria bacterium GW2011_GWB1_33_38]KKP57581.1 MAG: hypothetical protein UR48_C0014G0010 [Microgenomates group bacteriu
MKNINNILDKLKPKLLSLDMKFQSLIPNPKLRKLLYYAIGVLFVFMLFLILLGLILSPFMKNGDSDGLTLNKPKIEAPSPATRVNLNSTQKELLELENKVRDLKFPESILTIPNIESGIKIQKND